ncbi:MAG: response regulator [Burkholderiaceae bacterium]|nr:response regulator [Burkholderiaceae bacterium]
MSASTPSVALIDPPRPFHLLVVDDDDVDRERVLRLLRRSPLNVHAREAASSADALQMVREHEFDCVMLDNHLGDITGADLLPALHREALRDCPIIMVTGAGSETLAVQALRDGAADYLTKLQLNTEVLVRAIQRAVDHHRMQLEIAELHRRLEERVEEQTRFAATLIDHSPVGCAVYQADGLCVMCNHALAKMAGRGVQDLLATDLWSWLADEVPELAKPALATLDDGDPRRVEIELRRTIGPATHADCTLVRSLRDGRPHLLVFAHDVSRQRQALDALVLARDAAQDATRTKSNFLANMSHEIRTPMNAIVGLSRLALEDELPPGARDYLDKVHSSASALMGLLDDVLDYSKIEAGKLHFEAIPFDVQQAVQRVVDVFAARIDQKGIEFVVDLPPELPPRLVGDPLRLSQVLNNLVGNAVKFTGTGHIHLVVRTLPAGSPGRCALRFSVHDTGIGIDPAHRTALFEAFTQADGSITRRFGGSGLGLAICKRLVEMMGGQIGVDSVHGHGSEFWFTIELPTVDDNDRMQSCAVADLRVLLVDGGSVAGHVIESQLQAWHVEVVRCAQPLYALERIDRARRAGCPFDVLLIDWRTADADGIRALMRMLPRQAAGEAHTLRVLAMVTAFGRDSMTRTLTDDPPDSVLLKPVLASPLLEALVKVCEHRSLSDGLTGGEPTAGAGTNVATQARLLRARAAPLAGARILLAEDNPLNQLVAQQILERMGMTVTVVVNGAEALARLEQTIPPPFDAVLMDLHMPVLDGLETTRRIRSRLEWSALPVIGMTAAAMAEDRARCLAAGMLDHLAKPVMPERLLDILLKWIPRAHRATEQSPVEVAVEAASGLPDPLIASLAEPTAPVPEFNLDALRKRVMGNEALVWRLLERFVELESGGSTLIEELLTTERHDELQRKVHSLRGACALLELTSVVRACERVEAALSRSDHVESTTRELMGHLDAAVAVVREVVENRRLG